MSITTCWNNETKVEYSSEVGIGIGEEFYSAFQRLTYIARVTFPDGHVVVVVLPNGAASKPAPTYLLDTIQKAEDGRSVGWTHIHWDD